MKHKMVLLNALSTRMNNISSTIRATLYKQGERNIVENILNANGYEGVIEVYAKELPHKQQEDISY